MWSPTCISPSSQPRSWNRKGGRNDKVSRPSLADMPMSKGISRLLPHIRRAGTFEVGPQPHEDPSRLEPNPGWPSLNSTTASPMNQVPCFNLAGGPQSLVMTGFDVRSPRLAALHPPDDTGTMDATVRTRLGASTPRSACAESYSRWPGMASSGWRAMYRRVPWRASAFLRSNSGQSNCPSPHGACALTNIAQELDSMVSLSSVLGLSPWLLKMVTRPDTRATY